MKKAPSGLDLIAAERQRQIESEGWSADHDDHEHEDHGLAMAAACYAAPQPIYTIGLTQDSNAGSVLWQDPWPWSTEWDKRPRHRGDDRLIDAFDLSLKRRIRCLAKAGALAAAEIDRLQRLDARRREAKET